jgi:MOSC domain-containing protein YiiM
MIPQFTLFIISLVPLVIYFLSRQPHLSPGKSGSQLSKESGEILSVSLSITHAFSKTPLPSITLLENLGVEGDCHAGVNVQHRSRLHIQPAPPNLRQVHLIQSELFAEFEKDGNGKKYVVRPGELGENITTRGLDLLALGRGTRLHFLNPRMGQREEANERGEERWWKGKGKVNEMEGDHAIVRVTGLRNPCLQISKFQAGLQERCLVRNAGREIVERKAGIMSVVEVGGVVMKGARIAVEAPEKHEALPCV